MGLGYYCCGSLMTGKHTHTCTRNWPFQKRVLNWLMACFSMEVCRDTTERNHRFLEEALELVQSTGCTRSEAHQLVNYVFDRPVGDPFQEVGGATITLSALCSCIDIDQDEAGEAELTRISIPAVMEKVRAKQAAKPKHSPLPESVAHQLGDRVKVADTYCFFEDWREWSGFVAAMRVTRTGAISIDVSDHWPPRDHTITTGFASDELVTA